MQRVEIPKFWQISEARCHVDHCSCNLVQWVIKKGRSLCCICIEYNILNNPEILEKTSQKDTRVPLEKEKDKGHFEILDAHLTESKLTDQENREQELDYGTSKIDICDYETGEAAITVIESLRLEQCFE